MVVSEMLGPLGILSFLGLYHAGGDCIIRGFVFGVSICRAILQVRGSPLHISSRTSFSQAEKRIELIPRANQVS